MIDLDELERKVFLAQESECGYSWADETEWLELFENCKQHGKFIAALSPAVAQELIRRLREAEQDSKRIDWLADPNNNIGNVQLPTECVLNNLHSLRAAIDAALEMVE